MDLSKERTMLVLSRHEGEGIMIDDNIRVVLVDIKGDKVRLGIEAPKEVKVHRDEVYAAIKRKEAIANRKFRPLGAASCITKKK